MKILFKAACVLAILAGGFGCFAHIIARTVDHEELDVRGFAICWGALWFGLAGLFW